MPSARAVGGKLDRKSRTDLVRGEKGLNFVRTSVMKRDIILDVLGGLARSRIGGSISQLAISSELEGSNYRSRRARSSWEALVAWSNRRVDAANLEKLWQGCSET